MVVESDGEPVTVTVNKLYTATLQGQGLKIEKSVTPTTANPNTPTTFKSGWGRRTDS